MTRSELAEAVNAHVWVTTGSRRVLDSDMIGRYERGLNRWPNADYRAGLRAVLGATSDSELGFFPTRRGNTTVPKTPVHEDAKSAPGAFKGVDSSLDLAARGWAADGSTRPIDDLCGAVLSYAPAESGSSYRQGRTPDPRPPLVEAFAAYQNGSFELAAEHATAALRAVSDTLDPGTKALTYQIASIVLAKAGHKDLAWIAADRGVAAANAGSDPDIHLSLLRTTAFVMAVSGRADPAIALIDAAAQDFQPAMARTSVAASIYGTLLLTGAVLSAGQGNSHQAETYLDEANQAASVIGHDRNELWTAFGPTNVAIHRANVAAAASDMDTVLTVGGHLDVNHMPTERRVRLHLDIARASLAVGDREDALATLVRAEASAPSQVRHHHITKDVVNSLVETATRRPGVELTRLAHAVGIPA
jgi:tetratricopeptide (TPR) repeat protein